MAAQQQAATRAVQAHEQSGEAGGGRAGGGGAAWGQQGVRVRMDGGEQDQQDMHKEGMS